MLNRKLLRWPLKFPLGINKVLPYLVIIAILHETAATHGDNRGYWQTSVLVSWYGAFCHIKDISFVSDQTRISTTKDGWKKETIVVVVIRLLWPTSSLQCFPVTFWYHLSSQGTSMEVILKKPKQKKTYQVLSTMWPGELSAIENTICLGKKGVLL